MKVPGWMVEDGTPVNELIELTGKIKKARGKGLINFMVLDGRGFLKSPAKRI